jgi:membrane protease YdiL (CAAX protease family)
LLGLALTRPPGSTAFSALAAALAGVWLVGGLLSGPLQLGRAVHGRHAVRALILGALAFALFAAGAEIVHGIPVLHSAVNDVIERADAGGRALVVGIAILNAIGEEVFFRGAVYRVLGPRRPVLWTTVCYSIVTAAAGNLMLVVAAALMGTVFALERRASHGVLASMITHVTWSILMIYLLPR